MAFNAHIDSIAVQGVTVTVQVTFNDTVSGFKQSQVFSFPTDGSVTLQSAQNQITATGTALKASLAVANNLNTTLQSQVGTTIVI